MRTALVTGGAGDIGRAIGQRLAADGFHVILVDVRDDPGVAHDRVTYARADVTDRAALDAVVAAAPGLDVAIANAAVSVSAPFLDITADQWRRHLDVNLTGAFHTAQAAAARMVRDGTAGLLLFTGSWVGRVPWPEIAAYTTTKAGVEMLARQAARELAGHGIRANVVAPGIVNAGMARHQLEHEPQYAARAVRVVPLREFGTPEQVADAVSFLCSPGAAYMTGSTLLVDGGASLFAVD